MIVRESPKARARREPQNWPPKSPHDALLSSPGARKKYERERARNSTSPSPMKRRPMSRAQLAEEEDDEETLQLQLEAIEARLKLKKIQQAKARQAAENGDDTRAPPANATTGSSRPGTAASARRVDLPRPNAVEVPMSPVRNKRPPEEQRSPVRVMLGIDKGLRAQDVSLKRASSLHARGNTRDASRPSSRTTAAPEPPRKTFSERIAEARMSEKERQEKQARIEKSRSRGFGFRNTESPADALSAPSSRSASATSGTGNTRISRERPEMPPPSTKSTSLGVSLLKSPSIGDLPRSSARPTSNLSFRSELSRTESTLTVSTRASFDTVSSKTSTDNVDARSLFESFSGLHLSKRHIAHNTLTRTLDSKTIYTIPQLLKIVKSPDYLPPDVENDFVVMGIIASTSAPLSTKTSQHSAKSESDASTAGKFMVIRLTDLKWELDLFLFDTGFSRFYKLTTGTLVAILNPEIMPPRQKDTGKFSLKLTSSDDTVLEIGVARDLQYCSALRKDGKECGQWIDGRKAEACDFHIELKVDKARRGRMEVNTMSGFGKGKGFGRGRGRGDAKKDDGFGMHHDAFLHETMYIAPGAGATAGLLDDDGAFESRATRAEQHRKRLAEKEKERELAKKLGEMGRGTGSEYMRVKGTKKEEPPQSSGNAPLSTTESETIAPSTAAQILLGKKATDVSLAPVKRKRTIGGAPKEPVGWGGAFKRGLLLPDEKRETSPSKKKARFMLEDKGIREPGRESIGGLDVGLVAAMDDDDDDDGLDII